MLRCMPQGVCDCDETRNPSDGETSKAPRASVEPCCVQALLRAIDADAYPSQPGTTPGRSSVSPRRKSLGLPTHAAGDVRPLSRGQGPGPFFAAGMRTFRTGSRPGRCGLRRYMAGFCRSSVAASKHAGKRALRVRLTFRKPILHRDSGRRQAGGIGVAIGCTPRNRTVAKGLTPQRNRVGRHALPRARELRCHR